MRTLSAHVLITGFLLMSALGLLLTVFNVQPPFWRPLALYSYGMMAPYRGYETEYTELTADVQDADGVWHRADISPYLPFGRGERSIRAAFLTFRWRGEEAQAYGRFAEKLLAQERAAGRGGIALRVCGERWPASPAGYGFLRREPFITRTCLATAR